MDPLAARVQRFIADSGLDAQHLTFARSCHSVAEAAEAAGARPEDFIKTVLLMSAEAGLVAAIVKGEDRVSTTRVAGACCLTERPRPATPEEMLERTGFPAGGTPPFGFDAVFLIDERVMEMERVYAGGGSATSLVRIATRDLPRANGGRVTRVRK